MGKKKTPKAAAISDIDWELQKMTKSARDKATRAALRAIEREKLQDKRRAVGKLQSVQPSKHTVLAISDLHCPYQHPDSLEFLKAMKTEYEPDIVICMGDEGDHHAISNHMRSPDLYSAGHEIEAMVDELGPFYDEFPHVRVAVSNHPIRAAMRAAETGIPEVFLKKLKTVMGAPPGWSWHNSIEVDGVIYEHGSRGGKNIGIQKGEQSPKSRVYGHFHGLAGVQYTYTNHKAVWVLNTGCLINPVSYAFQYGALNFRQPILGSGIIVKGIPHFQPMLLDKKGRWTGEL